MEEDEEKTRNYHSVNCDHLSLVVFEMIQMIITNPSLLLHPITSFKTRSNISLPVSTDVLLKLAQYCYIACRVNDYKKSPVHYFNLSIKSVYYYFFQSLDDVAEALFQLQ